MIKSAARLGFSKDSRVPAEFDITNIFTLAQDDFFPLALDVIVVRFSDGYYLEDQDMWNLRYLHEYICFFIIFIDLIENLNL